MRPFFSRLFLGSRLGLSCALVAMAGLFGACDGHSPQDVPESYGHGSSHSDSYKTHQTDSHPHTDSFSDTRGINAGQSQEPGGEHNATPPAASPEASQSPHFFPNGQNGQ